MGNPQGEKSAKAPAVKMNASEEESKDKLLHPLF